MSVYAAIADHIRDLVLDEICPTAEFDTNPENSRLRTRISNTTRVTDVDELLTMLEWDEPNGIPWDAVAEASGDPVQVNDWIVYVYISTANSAPLVTFLRIVPDEPGARTDAVMRVDLGRPSQSDPLREALLKLCRHPDDLPSKDRSSD